MIEMTRWSDLEKKETETDYLVAESVKKKKLF